MTDFKRLFLTVRGQRLRPATLIGTAIVVGLLGSGAFVAVAQQATPEVLTKPESQAFPAGIYNGTCANLGQLAFPLAPVGILAGSTIVGQTAVAAYQSVTGLEAAALSDLISGPFAIAVGAEDEGGRPAVACGEVGGTQLGDTLLLGLRPVGDSGYAGVAMLSQAPSSTTLNVVVYLTSIRADVATPVAVAPTSSPQADSTPVLQPTVAATQSTVPAATAQPTQSPGATAVTGGQAQNQVTVTLNDIYFSPNLITVPANTPVTLILENNGVASHNFSVTDHNNPNLQNLNISVDVQPGQSGTATINAPAGTYYFFCNVPGHEAAGMFGYLIVQDGAAIATQEATVTPPAGS